LFERLPNISGEAVNHGNDNLWHSADIACFSSFSHHADTVLALREYFPEE
jgi:hypothetical protein